MSRHRPAALGKLATRVPYLDIQPRSWVCDGHVTGENLVRLYSDSKFSYGRTGTAVYKMAYAVCIYVAREASPCSKFSMIYFIEDINSTVCLPILLRRKPV
eukprot:SAG31_NODE_11854_length_992_cov_1.032475_1_plen_101_part_00